MQTDATSTLAEPSTTRVASKPRWVVFAISLLIGLAGNNLLFGHKPGIAFAAFVALVAAGSVVAALHSGLADGRKLSVSCLALPVALIPLVENVSQLSFIIGLCGLCLFVLAVNGSLTNSASENAIKAARLITSGPFTFFPALIDASRSLATVPRGSGLQWTGWLLPIGLGFVFIYLFKSANPIIEQWLTRFDLLAWLSDIHIGQAMFCLVLMVLTWPFLQDQLPQTRFRWVQKVGKAVAWLGAIGSGTSGRTHLFGHAAIVRSLVLFNALFAVQTALDVAYLWGGRELPEGMSFAEYAHRGAYPLVATALIAAAFTLITLRRGSETEKSAQVRNLVLLWTGQNVLLVASSIFRLDLYVSVYSLTMLRVEAFVWMGLVAIGLLLIMVRVLFNHSNAWLVRWNVISLAATLYACSLVNFPAVIAQYNVEHSREVSGKGVSLDVRYLYGLGPQVIPALERYLTERKTSDQNASLGVRHMIFSLKQELYSNTRDWRSWSLRNARLKKLLNNRRLARPRNGHTLHR